MWDDAKQMNAIAATLGVLIAIALAWTGVTWVVRQPMFALREVVVTSPLVRANAAYLEAVVREELTGTFFTMDLDRARRALAQLPWVRNVALRRQWPHRLEVTVEEHAPFARWNDGSLVNAQGEVFVADAKDDLPAFEGPDGRSTEMTAQYRAWSSRLAPLALGLRTLRLSPRGGWQIKAAGPQGPLTIELGRDDPDARLARFVAVQPRTLGALSRAGTRVDSVDLRYRNGFAARLPQFREKSGKPAA
ncbi:MAG: cell division protein FtsQ/DivIB [Betaproteobacteria bacterium]